MIRKRPVPVKLSEDELSLINTALLVSPFKNRREFNRLVARTFSESARKTVELITGCSEDSTLHDVHTPSLSEEEVKRLLDFVRGGSFHRYGSFSTSVLIRIDDRIWEFMKRNFILGPLVKSCIIHAAKKMIEKSQRSLNAD